MSKLGGRKHQWSGIAQRGGRFRNGPILRDPRYPGPPFRCLADMTAAEISAIEAEYGAKVQRPIQRFIPASA